VVFPLFYTHGPCLALPCDGRFFQTFPLVFEAPPFYQPFLSVIRESVSLISRPGFFRPRYLLFLSLLPVVPLSFVFHFLSVIFPRTQLTTSRQPLHLPDVFLHENPPSYNLWLILSRNPIIFYSRTVLELFVSSNGPLFSMIEPDFAKEAIAFSG